MKALLAVAMLVPLVAGCTSAVPDNVQVQFTTSRGNFTVEMMGAQAPKTVANFLTYANEGFYDGVLFHRIIQTFMIQGGGMGTDGKFKTATHPMIQNEARSSGLKNLRYTLSMARLGPECGTCPDRPDSATNQFFINTADNSNLDATSTAAGYAVFGKVVQGQSVIDAIAATPVTMYNAPGANKHCQGENSPSCPVTDVVITHVKVL